MINFPAAENILDLAKILKNDDYYINNENEERMCELLFSSQQPKAKSLVSIVVTWCFHIFGNS